MAWTGNKWTLADLRNEVESFMDDTGNTRWSDDDFNRAIRAAVRSAPPKWWEEREDDSHTYDEETFRYALPPACASVEELWFEPLSSDKPRKFVVPNVWHVEGNYLVFTDTYPKYDGQTLYFRYIVYPTNLLTVTDDDGKVEAGDLDAFKDTDATFITNGVRVGDPVEVGTQGTFYVESVDSETQLTLHKDMTAATDITYYVARYTDLPVTYVQYYAAAMLYEAAARNRPGVELEDYLTLARYYRSLAELELNKQRKPRPVRRRY